MKVLIWAEQFHPSVGGIEVFLADLIRDLRKQGVEFEVIANTYFENSRQPCEFEGVAVHRFSFHKALANRDIKAILEISSEISRIKTRFSPDVIHYNTSGPSLFFDERSKSACRAGRLFTVHGYWEEQNQTPDSGPTSLLCRALNSADVISVVSQEVYQRTAVFVPENVDKMQVVYCGRHLNQDFANSLPHSLSCDPPRILCLGRAVYEKGFDIMLSAMVEVLEHFPQARLTIAGDGDALADLKKQSLELGVSESVEFLGEVAPQYVAALINSSSMLVVPSRWREALGLVAVEGCLSGRPVIAADIGGLPEALDFGRGGILCPIEDTSAFADACMRLLSDPKSAESLASHARSYARRIFDWAKCASSYLEIYQRCAHECKPSLECSEKAQVGEKI